MFQPKPLSRIIFDGHDTNKDGLLDLNELRLVFYDLGRHYTKEEMVLTLNKLDRDKDHRISYSEFLDWWRMDDRFDILTLSDEEQKFLTGSVDYFKYFDKNLDGILEDKDLEALKESLQFYNYQNVHNLTAPLTLEDYIKWLIFK